MAQVMEKEKEPTMLGKVFAMKPTPRVDRLREAFLSLKPSVSIDRARIETRVMKETEGESVITRRAKVFAATVREMPIYVYPGQLLAGCIGARPRCYSIVPGLNAAMRKAGQAYILGLREDLPFDDLSDEEKREIIPYRKGNGKYEKSGAALFAANPRVPALRLVRRSPMMAPSWRGEPPGGALFGASGSE